MWEREIGLEEGIQKETEILSVSSSQRTAELEEGGLRRHPWVPKDHAWQGPD